MIIVEYRVTLPLSLDEYRIGQLYTVAEASKQETGGGEGIEILKNEPFSDYPLFTKKVHKPRRHGASAMDQSGSVVASTSKVICECPKSRSSFILNVKDAEKRDAPNTSGVSKDFTEQSNVNESHGTSDADQDVPKTTAFGSAATWISKYVTMPWMSGGVKDASGRSEENDANAECPWIFKYVTVPWISSPAGADTSALKNEAASVTENADETLIADIVPFSSGQYTYKIYRKESKVPAFVRLLAPKGSLELHEESWNSYPYCRTVFSNPYMKDAFKLRVESFHIADAGDSHNVHELPPEKLRQREVVSIDIANDPVPPGDYRAEHDPAKFRSAKTGRGPLLGPDWRHAVQPVMTCYKLVTAEFKWFGLQNKAEHAISATQRRLFNVFHRQIFCTIDQWYGLTLADIRQLERDTQRELNRLVLAGGLRGALGAD